MEVKKEYMPYMERYFPGIATDILSEGLRKESTHLQVKYVNLLMGDRTER